jgi:peptidylprolyl isomerase
MLRAWPLIAASLLLGVLALACGDDEGEPSAPSPSPALEPTPINFAERPEITIDPDKKYFADVETTKGTFRIKLRPDIALQTVNSFIFLAREGFYDGVTFHRVIPGFVAQGGDPTGTGSGGPGYTLPAEFSDVPFKRGTVGLARSNDPDSGGSQFFIAYAAKVYDDRDDSGDASAGDIRLMDVGPLLEGSKVAKGDPDIGSGLTTVSGLNGLYTVFGTVVEGMKLVDSLTPRDPANIATPQPQGDTIITITIQEGE